MKKNFMAIASLLIAAMLLVVSCAPEANVEGKVEDGLVEAVIGLGPNLFFNAPMEACVVICNNHKPMEMLDKIIFINAKNEVTRKNAESYLEDKHIRKILSAYHSAEDIKDFKRIVDLAEIKKNHYDLTVQKYVFINEITNDITYKLSETIDEWKKCSINMTGCFDKLIDMIEA